MTDVAPPTPDAPEGGRSLARSTALMTAGTVISRGTGVIRLAVVAATLGVVETRLHDTYNLANTAPNILYELVLGGVITSVFVPVFVELLEKEDRERAWRSMSAILNLSLAALAVIALLGVLFAPVIATFYASRLEGALLDRQHEVLTFLLRLLIPQVFLYGIYFIVSGILNANRRFVLPMWTPIVNNFVIIGVFVAFRAMYGSVSMEEATNAQLLLIGLGTTASVAPMGLMLLPALKRLRGYRPVFTVDRVLLKKVAGLSAYVLGFVAANQLGYLVVQWLANGRQGGYTAYIAAYTFFILPVGLFVWSVTTAMVPSMSRHAIAEEWDAFRSDVSLALRAILFLILPSTVGYLLVARPLVELMLEHGVVTARSTDLVTTVLWFFVAGLLQFSLYQVFVRAFYALQDAKTPFFINCAVVVVTVAVNVPMYAWLGVKGLAAGQAIAYTLGVPLQAWVLGRRAGGLDLKEITGSFFRLAGATAAMAVVVWGALQLMGPLHDDGGLVEQAVAVTVPVAAGAAVYLAVAAALKAPELSFVRSVVRRRRSGATSGS